MTLRDALLARAGTGLLALRVQPPTELRRLPVPADEVAPVLCEALVVCEVNPTAAATLETSSDDLLGATCAAWWSWEVALAALAELWTHGRFAGPAPLLSGALVTWDLEACWEDGRLVGAVGTCAPARSPLPEAVLLAALPGHVALLDAGGRCVASNGGELSLAAAGFWSAALGRVGANALVLARAAAEAVAPGASEVAAALGEVLGGRAEQASLVLPLETGRDQAWVWVHTQRTSSGVVLQQLDVTALRAGVGGGRDQVEHQDEKLDAVSRLAGGVAHEFNNLLTAIGGYCELLLGALPHGSERSDVEEIRKASDRATLLTRQLLAFGRRQILHAVPLDLNELLRGLTLVLDNVVRPARLDVALGRDVRPVLADPAQLQHVLVNLLVNARDAVSDEGRVTVRTATVEVAPGDERELSRGTYALLEVSDTGPGIDAALHSRVFEPFFTTRPGRSGMGLAMVDGIVRQSGGHVAVRSEPGRGTSIRVFLPQAGSQSPRVELTPTPAEGLYGGDETILLVEDEDAVRVLLRDVLARRGYRVLDAHDPREAQRLVEDPTLDLDVLVTDVVMPGMTGVELARRLQADRQGLRVLFISGYTEEELTQMRTPLGPGSVYLGKPFSPQELLRALRELLSVRVGRSNEG